MEPDVRPSYQPPGQRLGRYELLGKLATGGMGEIHLARLAGDGGFEKLVVVKRLLPELVASREFVAMFLDEARIASRLSHPNVCEVYELGRDGNDYYLAMQYLAGISFADLIASPREADRARELRLVAALITQAAEGLHHAHEARGADGEPLGLVHRDVSPSNLFVTTDGVVKVLDFGIAKARGASARTEVGTIKGKYAYMSPEQVSGSELDRRSDVFALGIVLFELATHQRLFKRPSDFLTAKAIIEEPIPRADAVDPAVPAALADVVERALSRDPAARFPSARELGAAVAAAVAPMTASEVAARVAENHATELSQQRTRQEKILAAHRTGIATVPLRPRRHPRRALAPLALLLLPLAALLWVPCTAPVSPSSVSDTEEQMTAVPAAQVSDTEEQGTVVPSEAVDASAPLQQPQVSDTEEQGTGVPGRIPDGRRTARYGYVRIDSTPYAVIYIDGKRVGETPLIDVPVKAGRRRVRAVLETGAEKAFSIDVPAGKHAAPKDLRW